MSNIVDKISSAVGQWRRYRDIVAELEAYSDRELDDIGIMRADIPRVAEEAARVK